MEISSSMAVTIESVRLALGASSLRQSLIADNIANVNTPDHVRMKVVFEQHLADALGRISDSDSPAEALSELGGVEPQVTQDSARGTKVALEQEMVALSANALRYQALTRGLSRYMSIASAIASGSRG